jgi:acyl carrier protein
MSDITDEDIQQKHFTRDLGFDSFDLPSIVVEVESQFDCELPEDGMDDYPTYASLYAAVCHCKEKC